MGILWAHSGAIGCTVVLNYSMCVNAHTIYAVVRRAPTAPTASCDESTTASTHFVQ